MKKRTPWEIQKTVVFALVMREIKTRLGGNWMGVLWLIGIPLAQMIMLVWINTVLRGRLSRAGYDFMIYLVVALIPYEIFRHLWSQLARAVKANRGLFGYRQVKPMDTFVARTLLELTLQLLILVAILVLFDRLGFGPVIPVDPLAYVAATGMFAFAGCRVGCPDCRHYPSCAPVRCFCVAGDHAALSTVGRDFPVLESATRDVQVVALQPTFPYG